MSDIEQQRKRFEAINRKFERAKSDYATCQGRLQAALEALKEFGVSTVDRANTLSFRAKRKQKLLERDLGRLLDELEEELDL